MLIHTSHAVGSSVGTSVALFPAGVVAASLCLDAQSVWMLTICGWMLNLVRMFMFVDVHENTDAHTYLTRSGLVRVFT